MGIPYIHCKLVRRARVTLGYKLCRISLSTLNATRTAVVRRSDGSVEWRLVAT